VLLAVRVVLVGIRASCRCWALVVPVVPVVRVMPGVVMVVPGVRQGVPES
jgi:hypothetical protein